MAGSGGQPISRRGLISWSVCECPFCCTDVVPSQKQKQLCLPTAKACRPSNTALLAEGLLSELADDRFCVLVSLSVGEPPGIHTDARPRGNV
jgi:hypothetical protein